MVQRRAYAGGAVPTTLASGITNVATTATLTSMTGYPSGSSKWYAVIDRGEATEEKVLITNVAAFVVTMIRGVDGTVAQAHSPGAGFEHCVTAVDLDEANFHVAATSGEHGLPVGAAFVGTIGAQTIEDKTLDFDPAGGANIATNIPTTASPAIMAAIATVATDLTTEIGNRSAGDTARYTKTEADGLFVNIAGETMTGPLTLSGPPTANLHAATKAYVDAAMPIGAIVPYGGSAAPAGWLLCDGSAVSRTTYAALYAVLSTGYGAGNGTTTFNLPDLVGRIPVGLDSGDPDFNSRSDIGGAKTHTHATPAHSHVLSDNGAAKIQADDANDWVRFDNVTTANWTADSRTSGGTVVASSVAGTVGVGLIGSTDTGGSGVSDTGSSLQPYAVVNYIIRAS